MRSCFLCILSLEILILCQFWGAHVQVHYFSPCLIVLADSLLRFKPISMECRLDPTLFTCLRQLLTTLSIDLFATCLNILLPSFLSPFPDESSVGVEALCHQWEFPGVMYAFLRSTVNSSSRQDLSLVTAGPSASAGVA